MYCKNCGKPYTTSDKFCSNCGAKIEAEPEIKEEKTAAAPADAEKPKRRFHIDDFNWDLDGYPTDNKKTEDVDFNWASVMEEKQRKIFDTAPRHAETKAPEEPAAQTSLEDEIFADMGTLEADTASGAISGKTGRAEKVDKFYTFNKKNEELQALLEQEYERIKSGQRFSDEEEDEAENEIETEIESEVKPVRTPVEFDWNQPVESEPEPAAEPEPEASEEIAEEAPEDAAEYAEADLSQEAAAETVSAPAPAADDNYICTLWSQPPAGYIACEVFEKAAEDETAADEEAEMRESAAKAAKEKEVCPPSEEETDGTKLAFRDVFGDDDDEDSGKKKGKGLKTLAVILCLLVVAELCVIGIQYFAPDSSAGKMINNGYRHVLELVSGEKQAPEDGTDNAQASEIQDIIDAQKAMNQNIGVIEEDKNLVFESDRDYGFDGFASSYAFDNEPWYTNDEGTSVTYGDEIIGTIIRYYSSWVDYINGETDQVLDYIDPTSDFYTEIEETYSEEGIDYGINRLSIGEIRAGSAGFYVMVSTATVNSENKKETVENQVVYMEPDKKTMKIVDIKKI